MSRDGVAASHPPSPPTLSWAQRNNNNRKKKKKNSNFFYLKYNNMKKKIIKYPTIEVKEKPKKKKGRIGGFSSIFLLGLPPSWVSEGAARVPSSGRSCPFFPLHPSFPTDGGKMQKSGRKQEEDPRGTGRRRPGGGQGEARGRPGGGQGGG